MKNNGKQRRNQRRQGALKRRQGDVAAYELEAGDTDEASTDLERKLDIARAEVAALIKRVGK